MKNQFWFLTTDQFLLWQIYSEVQGIMGMDIQVTLDDILSKIGLDETYGGRESPYIVLDEGTSTDSKGVLFGAMKVLIRKRNGDIATLHRQSLDGIADEKELKDRIAESLSTVLSQHDKWPR